MSKFWTTVNADLEKIFGNPTSEGTNPSGTGLPDLSSLTPNNTSKTSPDAVKQQLQDAGYTPPVANDTTAIDEATLFGSVAGQNSPFTVIDLEPQQVNGTQPGQVYSIQNALPATAATLKAIFQQAGITFQIPTGVQVGITYQISVPGNFLRIERNPAGFGNIASLNSGGTALLPTNVFTQLQGLDTYEQSQLGLLFSGCFVQFDSQSGPVMRVNPGVAYKNTYTTLYVTVFGSGGRWRVISGNNARINGLIDDRPLRQNLAMWDGGGLLDQSLYHPVPYNKSLALNTTFTGGISTNIIDQNLDFGSKLTAQPNGNVVGQVSNAGFKIIWITEIRWVMQAGVTTPAAVEFILSCNGKVLWNDFAFAGVNGSTSGSFTPQQPLRVVIPGFPSNFNPSGNSSGTQCFINAKNEGSNQPEIMFFAMRGYVLPGLIPYNPYPLDTVNLNAFDVGNAP